MGAAGGAGLGHGPPAGTLGRGHVPEVVQAAIGVLRGQQVTSRCDSVRRIPSRGQELSVSECWALWNRGREMTRVHFSRGVMEGL